MKPIEPTPFEPRDFALFSQAFRSDPEVDPHRLRVRRRLAAIAEEARARLHREGLSLERRDSLHRPFAHNRHRVVAQWVYLARGAAAKRAFASRFGPEIGADLDPAFKNAHLCLAIDEEGLEAGLRIHAQAWIDAQNLKGRIAEAAGGEEFLRLLRGLPEVFGLRIHDFRKIYEAARANRDDLREVLDYFVPGEHGLRISRKVARADPLATSAAFPEAAAAWLAALGPLYRFAAWAPENDRLGLRRA